MLFLSPQNKVPLTFPIIFTVDTLLPYFLSLLSHKMLKVRGCAWETSLHRYQASVTNLNYYDFYSFPQPVPEDVVIMP
jgi:hypothetical protein